MIALILSLSALAGTVSRIDFDALSVSAEISKPSLTWVREVSSRLCAEAKAEAKVECQVNTDYGAIVKLCQSLRVADTSAVARIMAEAKTTDFNALGSPRWIGCMHNAKTGWDVFVTNFSHADDELVMYDDPGPWFRCRGSGDECGADSAFDSRDHKQGVDPKDEVRAFHSSYLLSVYRKGRGYRTVPAIMMQEVEEDKAPWYDFDGSRPHLPRFDLPRIVFLSGSLAVFQGEFTSGILFQSLTGHTYSEALK